MESAAAPLSSYCAPLHPLLHSPAAGIVAKNKNNRRAAAAHSLHVEWVTRSSAGRARSAGSSQRPQARTRPLAKAAQTRAHTTALTRPCLHSDNPRKAMLLYPSGCLLLHWRQSLRPEATYSCRVGYHKVSHRSPSLRCAAQTPSPKQPRTATLAPPPGDYGYHNITATQCLHNISAGDHSKTVQ